MSKTINQKVFKRCYRVIKVQGFGKPKFYCSECETNLTVEINKTLQ